MQDSSFRRTKHRVEFCGLASLMRPNVYGPRTILFNAPAHGSIYHADLCCGENLAVFYGITALTPDQIDPYPAARELFVARDGNGNVEMTYGHDTFQTPLWCYLLKEAELQGKANGSLGELGSRLVGEAIQGAIAWADESVFKNGHKDPTWTSKVPLADPTKVTLLDLARFVADY